MTPAFRGSGDWSIRCWLAGRRRFAPSPAALKQDMVAEGFPERSIEVVYNGIELGRRPQPAERAAARAALQLPGDAFVIGSVGRLDPVKNLGALLEALVVIGHSLSGCESCGCRRGAGARRP